MNYEATARLAHEINRAYCSALGDHSQKPWEEAPDWQKASAMAGVRFHVASGFTATPEQSHQNWFEQKQREGWKYGPEKDVEAKEHPCMVGYYELPVEQRIKDALFVAAVHATLKPRD